MKVAALLVVSLAVVLAGCLDAELTDPAVRLELVEAHKDGDCKYYIVKDRCDTARVRLVNENEKEDASTNQLHWDAVDQEGGVHEALTVHGPSAVVAGGSANLTVEFDVPQEQELTSLRYKAFWMSDPIEVPIVYSEP